MIKTREGNYCIIAAGADRGSPTPVRRATLVSFRDTFEDLRGDLCVTDPVSGLVVLALK
jgi:hypothetical protein